MNLDEFKNSLSATTPPEEISEHLKSLWYDAKNDWDGAHKIIQDLDGKTSAWIHAYLHRKEGDIGNADYWYDRANQRRPDITLGEEWESIVKALL